MTNFINNQLESEPRLKFDTELELKSELKLELESDSE